MRYFINILNQNFLEPDWCPHYYRKVVKLYYILQEILNYLNVICTWQADHYKNFKVISLPNPQKFYFFQDSLQMIPWYIIKWLWILDLSLRLQITFQRSKIDKFTCGPKVILLMYNSNSFFSL